ncbi:hypothetical protein MIR68_000544 [Amoeboaphelidium protococcarum]|nr:hypothetical protein MIR68_000544 [Amoeboaphelidium protococcarum]
MEHLNSLFKNIESDRQLLNLLDKSASVDGYISVGDLMKLDKVKSYFKSAQQLRQCILHPDGGKHEDNIEVLFHYDKATDCIKYLPIGDVNDYQKLCIGNQYARNSIYIEGFPRKWTRYALKFMLETVLGCCNKIAHIHIEYVQPKNDYNDKSSNDTKHGRSSDQKQQVSESVSNTAAKRALNKGFAFIEFTDYYLVDECLELFKPADSDQNTQQQSTEQSTQIYAKETLDRVQEWIHKLDKLQSDREPADVELLTELQQSLQPEELIIIARMMKVCVMKKPTWSLLKKQYLDYQLYKRCQQRVLQQMKNHHYDGTSRPRTGDDPSSATTIQNLSTIDFVKDTIVLAYEIPLKMFKKLAIAESVMNALKTDSKDCIAYIDMNSTEQLSCYIRFLHPAYTKQIINSLQQSDLQKEDSLPFKVRPLTVDEELREWTRIVNERKAKRVVAEKYSKDSFYSSKSLKSSMSSYHQTKQQQQQQQPSKSSGKKQSQSKGATGNKSVDTDLNVGKQKLQSGQKQKSKTVSNAVQKQEDKEEQEEENVVGDGEALLTFMKRPTDQDVVQGDIKKLKMK